MARPISSPSEYVPVVSFKDNSASFEMEVIDLASLQHRSTELDPSPDCPHRLGFNILLIIEDGEGEHQIDFEKVYFKPGSVLFVNAGQVHAFDFSKCLVGKAIVYTAQFLDTLQTNMSIPFSLSASMPKAFVPHIRVTDTLHRSFMRLTDELLIEMRRESPSLKIILSLFGALIMMLSRERNNPTSDVPPADTKKFIAFQKLIEKYYYASREASFYADKIGMSYKTLNILCKKISGSTAKAHIDHHIILEAKRRLMIDQSQIATIADDLGFNETTNFTKFFKRYVNTTPNQFRLNVRN